MASFGEITGRSDRDWAELCDTAPESRLRLVMLGPIVAAYEHPMTDGEGKNTWRTDHRYSPCPRPPPVMAMGSFFRSGSPGHLSPGLPQIRA